MIDKGLEETMESVMKDFDNKFPELSVIEGQGDEGSIHGYDAKPYVKDFLKSSLTLAFTRGRESIKSLDKK